VHRDCQPRRSRFFFALAFPRFSPSLSTVSPPILREGQFCRPSREFSRAKQTTPENPKFGIISALGRRDYSFFGRYLRGIDDVTVTYCHRANLCLRPAIFQVYIDLSLYKNGKVARIAIGKKIFRPTLGARRSTELQPGYGLISI
jgi:hypothetical protein